MSDVLGSCPATPHLNNLHIKERNRAAWHSTAALYAGFIRASRHVICMVFSEPEIEPTYARMVYCLCWSWRTDLENIGKTPEKKKVELSKDATRIKISSNPRI